VLLDWLHISLLFGYGAAMVRLILIYIMLFTGSSLVYSQQGKEPKPLSDAFDLPASIYDVKGVGQWKKGDDYGQLRLVITRSHKRDEHYLQWVKWHNKKPVKVVSTVMIKEIQESANFKTTFIRRELHKGKRQLVLGLVNQHDKSSSRAVIEITGVGRYRCSI
jgi:hypothetical protein